MNPRRAKTASGEPVDEVSSATAGGTAERMDAIARLAGVVAHDFSNVLTVILGHADMLLDACRNDEAVRSSVLEIQHAAGAGARVAADLLAISQRQSLHPGPVDLNELVRGLAETLGQIAGEQIDLRYDLAPALPLVDADRTQLERVLRALVVHGREVMPEGGRLSIVTAVVNPAGPAEVVLRVTDTGARATGRTAEPVFTGKKPSRGAGLALTTAYGIIRQSGGDLTVTQPAGRGATVTIALPARVANHPLSPR